MSQYFTSTPNLFVHVSLLAWFPITLLLFLITTPRRAVISSFIGAWLFLPMYGYTLPGLPDYTKISATGFAALLGILLFDAGRLTAFRPSLMDLPMVVWILCPFVSSPLNGLGVYDGMSLALRECIWWGVPYFVGRLYFSDLDSMRELAIGIVVGGLVYVPLCLYEIKMSPQLHNIIYGYFPHDFVQTKRWGGWRPVVFMQHGLMVGMWMAGATLVATWLWFSGSLRKLWIMPMAAVAGLMMVTTVLCKSTGALVLLAGGLGLLAAVHLTKMRAMVALAVLLPVIYVGARIQGWEAGEMVALVEMIDSNRAESVRYRVNAEAALLDRALQRPFFGWAGWGRNLLFDRRQRLAVASDSMWIIAMGNRGLVGLTALGMALLLPAGLLAKRLGPGLWRTPMAGAAAALAALAVVNTYDNLFNAMLNPVFIMATGGVLGLALEASRYRPQVMRSSVGPRGAGR